MGRRSASFARFVGEVRERPAETPAVAAADGATAIVRDAAAPRHPSASVAPRRYLWAAAAAALLVIAAGIVVLHDRLPADIDNPASPAPPVPPTPAAPPRPAPSERSQLVPELMPFSGTSLR